MLEAQVNTEHLLEDHSQLVQYWLRAILEDYASKVVVARRNET